MYCDFRCFPIIFFSISFICSGVRLSVSMFFSSTDSAHSIAQSRALQTVNSSGCSWAARPDARPRTLNRADRVRLSPSGLFLLVISTQKKRRADVVPLVGREQNVWLLHTPENTDSKLPYVEVPLYSSFGVPFPAYWQRCCRYADILPHRCHTWVHWAIVDKGGPNYSFIIIMNPVTQNFFSRSCLL